jgi:hypothetical protein
MPAWDFHGNDSTESGIRLLSEKGVEPNHPFLSKALHALENETVRLERGIGKVGNILDQCGLGGSRTIKAVVFAYVGIEDKPFVKEQIHRALAAFRAVLSVDTTADLVEVYKGKQIYRQGRLWPSIYHLRLLSLTHNWRTSENLRIVAASIQRLFMLSPLPTPLVRFKSQLIAPAAFCMDDFNPDLQTMNDAHWMMWFHRMELLSRMGVTHSLPEMKIQISALKEILDAGQGRFTKPLTHAYFRKWGAYTGLMLEKNWRAPHRRIYDLTFRSVLILHYYENRATQQQNIERHQKPAQN